MAKSKYENIYDRGILIVDDEIDAIDFLEIYLNSCGFTKLHKANSPIEAIGKLGYLSDDIFLVITDIAMPEMNGYEMVQQITNNHPIPVGIIFMTGFKYDPNHSAIKIKKDNHIESECLFKPFNRDKLLKCVNNALESVFNKRYRQNYNGDNVITDILTCISTLSKINQNNNTFYITDLVKCFEELKITYYNNCYISALSISGRILEISLKHILIINNITFDDNLMVGNLIKKINESGITINMHSSMNNIANIINQYRITSVHSKMQTSPPNREQTILVIYAAIEMIRTAFCKP